MEAFSGAIDPGVLVERECNICGEGFMTHDNVITIYGPCRNQITCMPCRKSRVWQRLSAIRSSSRNSPSDVTTSS